MLVVKLSSSTLTPLFFTFRSKCWPTFLLFHYTSLRISTARGKDDRTLNYRLCEKRVASTCCAVSLATPRLKALGQRPVFRSLLSKKALMNVNSRLREFYPESEELFDIVLMTNNHAQVGVRLINSINHYGTLCPEPDALNCV